MVCYLFKYGHRYGQADGQVSGRQAGDVHVLTFPQTLPQHEHRQDGAIGHQSDDSKCHEQDHHGPHREKGR